MLATASHVILVGSAPRLSIQAQEDNSKEKVLPIVVTCNIVSGMMRPSRTDRALRKEFESLKCYRRSGTRELAQYLL